MSNTELIVSIISILLIVVSSVLGLVAKHNNKGKKYYEGFVKVEEQIKKLMINAEGYYASGEQKKKYVVSNIQSFLNQNNINISDEVIDTIIESVINLSKNINR